MWTSKDVWGACPPVAAMEAESREAGAPVLTGATSQGVGERDLRLPLRRLLRQGAALCMACKPARPRQTAPLFSSASMRNRPSTSDTARAMREVRAEWRRAGKCGRCGGKRKRVLYRGRLRQQCDRCTQKTRDQYARRAARTAGDTPPTPKRGFGTAQFRLAMLLEVRGALRRSPNSARFERWLDGEIHRMRRLAETK